MAKTYEELIGAIGPAQRFRRERHDAGVMFHGATPRLFFDDASYELENISGSGLAGSALRSSDENDIGAVNRVGVLRLVQCGKSIFEGAARIARRESFAGRTLTGFALQHDQIDLGLLSKRNALALCQNAPEPAPLVSTEYKSFCADALAFVTGYLDLIDRNYSAAEASMSHQEINDIARQYCATAAPGWRAIVEQGNALVLPTHLVRRSRIAHKTYTQRILLRTLVEGEGWRRTYTKPLGYPGDYQIMNYIYDNEPIGSGVRAKFLHLLSLVGAEPVRTRMERLAELIVDRASTNTSGSLAVLSVGAGPTREVDEILRLSSSERAWRFTLVDQDAAALEFSLARIGKLGCDHRVIANGYHASFKEMLSPTLLAAIAGECAVIYSAGLVDYLNPLAARRFVRRLYELLAPGGSIIIGNVNDKLSGMIWPSEYLVDWSLFFRSREEMLAMAEGLGDAEISIETDSLNAVYFLLIRRPA